MFSADTPPRHLLGENVDFLRYFLKTTWLSTKQTYYKYIAVTLYNNCHCGNVHFTLWKKRRFIACVRVFSMFRQTPIRARRCAHSDLLHRLKIVSRYLTEMAAETANLLLRQVK